MSSRVEGKLPLSKRGFAIYMGTAYVFTFLVERSAARAGDSKLFLLPGWPLRFLLWYGFLFSVVYWIFKSRPLWVIFLLGIVIGICIEIVLFRGFFKISDLGYGVLFVLPFWVSRRFSA